MTVQLPSFSLCDCHGHKRCFPVGRPCIVTFVKEDCPVCDLVMPLLDRLGSLPDIEVLIIGQEEIGNRLLIERHTLKTPLLDDAALKVSFAWSIETVPTLIFTDGEGCEKKRLIGFSRKDWQCFFAELNCSGVDWNSLPPWRPGCGSKSCDPMIADRLRAKAENSPLISRSIELAPADDEFEFMFDQGFTDGLPVVPPTPERVMRMLSGTTHNPQKIVTSVPPNFAPATIEKIAINAVMAGCRPEHLPVVIAALEAVCTDTFNVHGLMATTMGGSPLLVVNGPIRERIGMNMKLGALGQGNRANACIGRALRLVLRNIGGAKPGGIERSTLGNPMKFTMCFAEWEERSNWESLHVERGFVRTESVVTVFPVTSGPQLIIDQKSRKANQLAASMALVMQSIFHPRLQTMDCVLVVCPEHVDTLKTGGYTKDDLRRQIQEVTALPLKERRPDALTGEGVSSPSSANKDEAELIPKFAKKEMIHIVVAGAEAGKFSGLFHGWVGGTMGSIPVSRKIEEVL